MQLLVEAREKAGMSQRDLARELDVHASWVAKVELQERRLDVVETLRIARILKVDAARILREVGRKLPR